MGLPSCHHTTAGFSQGHFISKGVQQYFLWMLLSHETLVATKKCSVLSFSLWYPEASSPPHRLGHHASERHASVQLRNRMWLKNMYFTNLLFNSIMSSNSFVQRRLVGRILMQCCVFLSIVTRVLNVTYPITYNHCWVFLNTRHSMNSCPVCPRRCGHNTRTHVHRLTAATRWLSFRQNKPPHINNVNLK